MYKLIAVDIDDTLLNTKKQITPKTKAALMNAQQNGVKLAVCSGRLPYGVRPYAEELEVFRYGGYYFGFNGGAILNSKGERISSTYLDSKYIAPVYDLLRPLDVTTMVHKGDVIYADKKVNAYTDVESKVIGLPLNLVDDIADFVDWDLHKFLIAGDPEVLRQTEKTLLDAFGSELDIYLSAPWFLEVMPKGISKGIGVEKICDDMGISPSEVIAFGDSFNDIPMIKTVGMGVAMGNAEEALKAEADMITDDCDHDGIAKALIKLTG
ncbi:MAG: Cof-type HAD-IIB family hydrolase [Ruminococcus sp.]|nr:Cof-type HAD-IIB family hydrolase [Ruminococcus sp.]